MDRTSKREAIKACLGVDPELARENLVDGTPQQRRDLLKKGYLDEVLLFFYRYVYILSIYFFPSVRFSASPLSAYHYSFLF